MQSMGRDEVEAVLGHEVSHIANGDMVTLTLIQGVVNTFVIFLARMIAGVVSNAVANNSDDGRGLGMFAYMGVVFVLEMCLGIVASIIVAWFSRQREYRADVGGAVLAGRGKMISALQALKQGQPSDLPGELSAFGINGGKSMADMMMSHPPLEKRIAALQAAQD
jgi:heat shock protein HtpX